ncbi:hypothetical protein VTL71DRAFT_6053 [Oculimacula yallundae]|uniref:Uncharacterized protein n=1 Tax=Oculimacula yallundae TaxID=86028 RepID=A0ABR4BZ95_9HELO
MSDRESTRSRRWGDGRWSRKGEGDEVVVNVCRKVKSYRLEEKNNSMSPLQCAARREDRIAIDCDRQQY